MRVSILRVSSGRRHTAAGRNMSNIVGVTTGALLHEVEAVVGSVGVEM